MVASVRTRLGRGACGLVRGLVGITTAVTVLVCTLAAQASLTLKVTPIPIVIEGGGTSTMVELRNEGQAAVRLQASTFSWSQTAAGKDVLKPTKEMLVFPSMLTLKAGQSRKVRVGTQGGYGAKEKAFRVIFAELPSNVKHSGQTQVVNVVARVSVPIFVRPTGSSGLLKVQSLKTTKDKIRFGVKNRGGAHARVDRVSLRFLGSGGKVIATKEVPGWYVLPGQTRPFVVRLGKDVKCAGATAVIVTAASRGSGSASATIAQPACAGD